MNPQQIKNIKYLIEKSIQDLSTTPEVKAYLSLILARNEFEEVKK